MQNVKLTLVMTLLLSAARPLWAADAAYLLFPDANPTLWKCENVELTQIQGPNENKAIQVSYDFRKKEYGEWSRKMTPLADPHVGALQLWLKSDDIPVVSVQLRGKIDNKYCYFICGIALEPGRGWQQITIPFEEFRQGADGYSVAMTGIDTLCFNVNSSQGEQGTLAFAEPVFVPCEPRKQVVFPAECNKRETADIRLPVWKGKLAITNMPWDAMIASAAADPEVVKEFASWKAQAEKWAADPVIQRPCSLKDVEAANWLDPRCKNMTGWQKEKFAMAMASGRPWMDLGRKLPMAAMVVRQSGDPKALDYLNRQLAVCATWFPFQVQGWTLMGSSSLPVKDDGPWLADCYAMVTLGLTMSMAGDHLDPQVKAAIREITQKEIDWIVRAWKEKIPWYVRSQACGSNQWALPAAALVLGCMILEDDRNRDAYELGVNALARHLSSQGQSGSNVEGYGYASMTMEYMLPVLWMMARNGDLRLNEYPYLKNYASWFHQMNLPGKRVINHSDSRRTRYAAPQRQILLASLLSGKLSDLWALDTFYSYLDRSGVFSQIYLAEVKKTGTERPELPRYA